MKSDPQNRTSCALQLASLVGVIVHAFQTIPSITINASIYKWKCIIISSSFNLNVEVIKFALNIHRSSGYLGSTIKSRLDEILRIVF